jgi:hypothetical protein
MSSDSPEAAVSLVCRELTKRIKDFHSVRARLLAQPPSSTLECRKSPALQDRAL